MEGKQSKGNTGGDGFSKKDVQISKNLSYILRHGAVKLGLNMQSNGYVLVEDILSVSSIKSTFGWPQIQFRN